MSKVPNKHITCWHDVTPDIFLKEISSLNQPAVLKGLVNSWPAVKMAKESNESLYQYFSSIYVGGDVRFARIPADENGRCFYNETMTGFNFKREITSLDSFFREVLNNSLLSEADILALQSAPIADYFPNFNDDNSNQQQRFITLIDIFYEKKVLLTIRSENDLNLLESSKSLMDPFKRTISRLHELTSTDYNYL